MELALPARTAKLRTTAPPVSPTSPPPSTTFFNHPNTGPFICRQLIQRLVTSNPQPRLYRACLRRVR
ncbi:MAG: DUF1800 family protein [Nibricoccus sp.]